MEHSKKYKRIVEGVYDFFTQGKVLRRKEVMKEQKLHNLTATGLAPRGTPEQIKNILYEKLLTTNSDELKADAEKKFQRGYISKATNYRVLAHLRDKERFTKKDLETAVNETAEHFAITGCFRFAKIYPIQDFDGTTIFFDHDETLKMGTTKIFNEDGTTTHKPIYRTELTYLLQALYSQNLPDTKVHYRTFITTGTVISDEQHFIDEFKNIKVADVFNHTGKEEPLEMYFDAIDCVPVVPPSFAVANRKDYYTPKPGKLYTELLQSLDIQPKKTIIISDTFLDWSADKAYPLALLTSPFGEESLPSTDMLPSTNAWLAARRPGGNHWLATIKFLERIGGEEGIYHAFEKLAKPGISRKTHETVDVTISLTDDKGQLRKHEVILHKIPNEAGLEPIPLYTWGVTPDVGYLGGIPLKAFKNVYRLERT